VSVLIPNYNHTRFVREAIDSALAQTLPPLEIIVVDDGSTDDCREVVAGYGDRVRYVYQENQGLAGARNTGLGAARGALVGLLDADDQWEPEFLARLTALARARPDAAVYHCRAQAMDERGGWLPQVLGGGAGLPPDVLRRELLRANFLIPSTIVVRLGPIAEAGYFDRELRSCEDWDLWLRLLPAHPFAGIDDILVRYRVHGSSLSGNPENMRRATIAVIRKLFGPDDGDPAGWSGDKRRAYGGVYRYFALTAVQRERDWVSGRAHVERALAADPSLATDLAWFYDLALGSQPVGQRGSAANLELADNASKLEALVDGLGPDVRGTALKAIGLVAYNTGQYALSGRYLRLALAARPALASDPLVVGDLVKSWVRRWTR
jgi:glycosyltransferase involved in cell wall biosynthesis